MENPNKNELAEKKNSHLFRNMMIAALVLFLGATIMIAVSQPKLFTAALTLMRPASYRTNATPLTVKSNLPTVTQFPATVAMATQPPVIASLVIEGPTTMAPLTQQKFFVVAKDDKGNSANFPYELTQLTLGAYVNDMITNITLATSAAGIKVVQFDYQPTSKRYHRISAAVSGTSLSKTLDVDTGIHPDIYPKLGLSPTEPIIRNAGEPVNYRIQFVNMTQKQIEECRGNNRLSLTVSNLEAARVVSEIKAGSLDANNIFTFDPYIFTVPGNYNIRANCVFVNDLDAGVPQSNTINLYVGPSQTTASGEAGFSGNASFLKAFNTYLDQQEVSIRQLREALTQPASTDK